MDDRTIMDNILSAIKGVCDLMIHGAIESSIPDVHSAFTKAFNETPCMQNKINVMSQKGWYSTQQAEQQKVNAVKQKFISQS